MADDQHMMYATNIVKQPAVIESYTGKYVLVADSSSGSTYHNLNKAICIMAENGWRAVNLTGKDRDLYVLMERIG